MGTPCVGNAPWSSGVDGEAVSAVWAPAPESRAEIRGAHSVRGPGQSPGRPHRERRSARTAGAGLAEDPLPTPRQPPDACSRPGPALPCAPRAPASPRQPSAAPSTLATCLLRTGRESTELAGCRRRSPAGRGVGGGERHARGAHIAHVSPASRASLSESGEHDPKGGQRQPGVLATRGPCTARRQAGEAAAL